MVSYGLNDAESDSQLLLSDNQIVFNEWLDVSSFSDSIIPIPKNQKKSMHIHTTTRRLAEFLYASLDAECDALKRSGCVRNLSVSKSNHDSEQTTPFLTRKELLMQLPLRVDVRDYSDLSDTAFNDVSLKQLRRDLERDRVVINGRRITGAGYGLDGIIAALCDSIDVIMEQCSLASISSSVKRCFATVALKSICRTSSGGVTFQCLRKLLDPADVMLVPVSTLAKALSIEVSVGIFYVTEYGTTVLDEPVRCSSQKKWGLRFTIRGITFFNLTGTDDNLEDAEQSPDIIEAMYENHICFTSDPRLRCIDEDDIPTGSATGGAILVSRHN